MSAISTYLEYIRSKIYAKDVRTAIVNAISQCYDDVNKPALQTEAMKAAVQAKIDAGQMAALTIGDGTITAAKFANGVIDNTLSQTGAAADAKAVGDEIADLKEDLSEWYGEKVPIQISENAQYINLSGSTADINNPSVSGSGFHYAVVPCSEGDRFLINAQGGTSPRAWGFLNSQSQIISVAAEGVTINREMIAPANAVYLVVNDKSGQTSYKISGDAIPERVAVLEEAVDNFEGISDEVKKALLACFQNVVWISESGNEVYNNLYRALYDAPTFTSLSDITNAWTRISAAGQKRPRSIWWEGELPKGVEIHFINGIEAAFKYAIGIGTNTKEQTLWIGGGFQSGSYTTEEAAHYTIQFGVLDAETHTEITDVEAQMLIESFGYYSN